MRKTLVMDPQTREMRVRFDDLWRGNHERTEYRVISARAGGDVVRDRPELDGRPVLGTVPGLYLRINREPWDLLIWAQETPVQPTVITPCPKALNARRKCALCSEVAA